MKWLRWVVDNWILALPIVAIIAIALATGKLPSVSEGNLRIVYILFVFFVIIKGMERSGLISWIAHRINKGRLSQIKLVAMSAALSMLITHDLALMTLVPITIAMDIEDKELMVILETLAANGAAALTPFGNPQNLFIYYFYNLHIADFISAILPLTIIVLAISSLLAIRIKTNPRSRSKRKVNQEKLPRNAIAYAIIFLLFLPVVLRIVPIWVSIIPLLYVIIADRQSLKIDYVLLFSFLAFFGLSNQLVKILKAINLSGLDVFVYTLAASQIMSNLPPVLLFAKFTGNWQAILWGSSIGAFGSIMGSLASVIAYRMYMDEISRDIESKNVEITSWSYLKRYHIYSFSMLVILALVYIAITGSL